MWVAAGGICCLYLACLSLLPNRPVFWSPDEGGKYLALRQMTATGDWIAPLPYPAASIDPQLRSVPLLYWLRVDDKIYSWWPVWFPVLSSGPYLLFGARGLFVAPLLSSLLIGLAVYGAVAAVSKRAAVGALIVVAVASPIWFYGLTYWEHTLHSLLMLLGFAAAIRGLATQRARWWALSGALCGLAFYLRLETVIFIGALGAIEALELAGRRQAARPIRLGAIAFSLSFIIAITPFLARNQIVEGHPLGRRNAADVTRTIERALSYGRESALEIIPNILVGALGHQGVDLKPYWRWLFVGAALGCFASGWLLRRGLDWPVYLAALALIALSGFVLLAPDDYRSIHGLILIAPFLAFTGWSLLPTADRTTRLWGVAATGGLGLYIIATALGGWAAQGGLQWGPRYALPLMAVMIVAVTRGAHALWRDAAIPIGAKRAAIGLLIVHVAIGLGFQIRGLRAMMIDQQTYVEWEAQLAALPAETLIVTEYPWLALTLPDVYESRAVVRAQPDTLPQDTLRRAAAQGFTQQCQTHIAQTKLHLTCTPLATAGP